MSKTKDHIKFEEMMCIRLAVRDDGHVFREISTSDEMAAAIYFTECVTKGLLTVERVGPRAIYRATDKGAAALSSYEKTPVAFMQALVCDALIIINENAGNDFEAEQKFMERLRNLIDVPETAGVFDIAYQLERKLF